MYNNFIPPTSLQGINADLAFYEIFHANVSGINVALKTRWHPACPYSFLFMQMRLRTNLS